MEEQENKTEAENKSGNFATLEDTDLSESLRQLKWSIIVVSLTLCHPRFHYFVGAAPMCTRNWTTEKDGTHKLCRKQGHFQNKNIRKVAWTSAKH